MVSWDVLEGGRTITACGTRPYNAATYMTSIREICFTVLIALSIAKLAGAQNVPTKPLTKEKYQVFAMTKPGDVARGKALFFDERRLACGRCHSVDGTGGKGGPDLFAAGDKFGRRE